MNLPVIFYLFFFFTITNFFVSLVVHYFIPYLGFFPFIEVVKMKYDMIPKFITSFANFDGIHYLLIADHGYYRYEQAFFPLYPIMIRLFSILFAGNLFISGLFVSYLSLYLGLIFLGKYLREISVGKNYINNYYWIVAFLLTFPTSFFFGAIYTESLFFLLVIISLYFSEKKQYYWSGFFAFLASLTKLMGVFLIISFLFKLFKFFKQKKAPNNKKLIFNTVSPVIGFLIYSSYLWITVRDPLFFLNSQWAYGANRSSRMIFLPQVIYRFTRIVFTARFNFQYFIALTELLIFLLVLFVLLADLKKIISNRNASYFSQRLSLNIFSFINIVLPTLTGTFSSVPRYTLMSISFFIFLSEIRSTFFKSVVVAVFFFLHVILLGFFIQGYFVS